MISKNWIEIGETRFQFRKNIGREAKKKIIIILKYCEISAGGKGRIKESLMIVSSLKNNCSSIHGCTVSSITREILKKEIFQFRNFKGHISFFLRSKDRFPSEKIDEVYFSIFSPPAESHKFPFSLSFPHIVKIAYIYI